MNSSVKSASITRWLEGTLVEENVDLVAVEEPLEIRLLHGGGLDRTKTQIAVTMRTPGHDFELALGFLFTEGIITNKEQVLKISYCKTAEHEGHIVNVDLQPDVVLDTHSMQRNFYASSSCGICGKASIEAVFVIAPFPPLEPKATFSPTLFNQLSQTLQNQQSVFKYTGGLHAAALFKNDGTLLLLREDIGRHNAVDKVMGAALSLGLLPLNEHILFVSGRAGFELVQKATIAGVAAMVAIGAPSSLAVELAIKSKMLLAGFTRNEKFNLYNGIDWLSVR